MTKGPAACVSLPPPKRLALVVNCCYNDVIMTKGRNQMKLNKDCVREVLIYLEEHLGYNDHLDASTIQIDPYTSEEILYTISLLSEAGYIKAVSVADLCTTPTYFVESILMPGHDLLDNIRDDNVWRKTKKIASKFASASLNVLSSVATSVLSSMLLNPPTV